MALLPPKTKRAIRKMLLAGELWADIQKELNVSSSTISKVKKDMLTSDTDSVVPTKGPKPKEKQSDKVILPSKVDETATVERLKQHVISNLLSKAHTGQLETVDEIRILSATTEKKELAQLANNLTINILNVVSNARSNAIEKVTQRKPAAVESTRETTIVDIAACQDVYSDNRIDSKSQEPSLFGLNQLDPIINHMSTNNEVDEIYPFGRPPDLNEDDSTLVKEDKQD